MTATLARDCSDIDMVVARRHPALPGFLARRRLAVDWLDGAPDAWSLRWILETCTAEVKWARADWQRITDNYDHDGRYDGPDLSERYRLPHEREAARVLNAHGHMVRLGLTAGDYGIHKAVARAKARASQDMNQSAEYRASWGAGVAPALAYMQDLRKMRRRTWRAFVAAAEAYRVARRAIDGERVAGREGVA